MIVIKSDFVEPRSKRVSAESSGSKDESRSSSSTSDSVTNTRPRVAHLLLLHQTMIRNGYREIDQNSLRVFNQISELLERFEPNGPLILCATSMHLLMKICLK